MSIKWISTASRAACLIGVIAVSTTSVAAEGAKAQNASATASSGFNWLDNGSGISKSKARARQAARRASYLSTRGGATWVCSPAGFGRKSRCHRG